jgi:hypothetical protein
MTTLTFGATDRSTVSSGEEVIQLSSIGPWEINYVNPADDPRLRPDSPSGQD